MVIAIKLDYQSTTVEEKWRRAAANQAFLTGYPEMV